MKVLTIPGLDSSQVEALINEWKMFTGKKSKGKQVVSFLGHFYSPALSFVLQPFTPRDSSFVWIHRDRFGGTDVVTPRDLTRPFSELVPGELRHEIVSPDRFFHAGDGGNKLALALVATKVQESLGDELFRRLTEIFGDQQWNDYASAGGPQPVVDIIHRNLMRTIECAIGYCLLDSQGGILPGMWQIFPPLLDLWRSGNLPLGLSRRNAYELNAPQHRGEETVKAIMLCAESTGS